MTQQIQKRTVRIRIKQLQNMRNGSIYENSDAALKDKLIADMRKQLSQLKELDHQYIKLLDEVKSVESKYSLLQDDGLRMENEYKIKADIARTNISQLRNELDGLKMQMHKYDVNIDEISREIANLNRINENKENQITGQMTLNQELEKNNEDQNEANRNLNQKIQSMKQQRNKYQAECERLRRLLEDCVNGLKALQKDARHIQSSNNRHETILQIAVADRDELINGLKSREELVHNTNKKLDELNKEREELKQKTNKLEKQCIKSDSDLKQVTTDLDNSIGKNKDLMGRLKNQQKTLRNVQGDLDRSLLERQALVKENGALSAEHDGLNGQIDRILLTIMQMQKFNDDLQRQIKFFIENDEEARKMLNRRQSMTKMLELVQNTLHRTSEQIAHLR